MLLTEPDSRAIKKYVAGFWDFERKKELLEWLNSKIAEFKLPKVFASLSTCFNYKCIRAALIMLGTFHSRFSSDQKLRH